MNFSSSSVTLSSGISLQEGRQHISPGRCEKKWITQKICVYKLEKGAVGQEKRCLNQEVIMLSFCPWDPWKETLPPVLWPLPQCPSHHSPPTLQLCGVGVETIDWRSVVEMKLPQWPPSLSPCLCLYSLPSPLQALPLSCVVIRVNLSPERVSRAIAGC